MMAAPAILQTLERAWIALEPLSLPMALAGGLALSAWRHPRATRDVDLIVAVDMHGADELVRLLIQAGFRPRHEPAIRPLGRMRILQLEFEPDEAFISVATDLLLVDSPYHREALSRRVALQLPELSRPIYVLSCEDLVLHKLIAGRIIDLADAAAVLRANRQTVDQHYLDECARRLGLTNDLQRVWHEALDTGDQQL